MENQTKKSHQNIKMKFLMHYVTKVNNQNSFANITSAIFNSQVKQPHWALSYFTPMESEEKHVLTITEFLSKNRWHFRNENS